MMSLLNWKNTSIAYVTNSKNLLNGRVPDKTLEFYWLIIESPGKDQIFLTAFLNFGLFYLLVRSLHQVIFKLELEHYQWVTCKMKTLALQTILTSNYLQDYSCKNYQEPIYVNGIGMLEGVRRHRTQEFLALENFHTGMTLMELEKLVWDQVLILVLERLKD